MVYLAQSQNPMAQLIQTILDIFSVFVAVVLACLILYANTFLIRRRKRELGTGNLAELMESGHGWSKSYRDLLRNTETGIRFY